VRRRIREVIRDLTDPRRATDQARDEIERLHVEHAALKVRLAKIEALTAPEKRARVPPKPRGRKVKRAKA
jgi:hypothetical protein